MRTKLWKLLFLKGREKNILFSKWQLCIFAHRLLSIHSFCLFYFIKQFDADEHTSIWKKITTLVIYNVFTNVYRQANATQIQYYQTASTAEKKTYRAQCADRVKAYLRSSTLTHEHAGPPPSDRWAGDTDAGVTVSVAVLPAADAVVSTTPGDAWQLLQCFIYLLFVKDTF